jgi:hypothetical protein
LLHGEPINDFSGFSQGPLRAVKAIALRGRLAQANHFADLKFKAAETTLKANL